MTPRRLVAELMPWVHLGLADQAALNLSGRTPGRGVYRRAVREELATLSTEVSQSLRQAHRSTRGAASVPRRAADGLVRGGRQGPLRSSATWRVWLAIPGDDGTCELCRPSISNGYTCMTPSNALGAAVDATALRDMPLCDGVGVRPLTRYPSAGWRDAVRLMGSLRLCRSLAGSKDNGSY